MNKIIKKGLIGLLNLSILTNIALIPTYRDLLPYLKEDFKSEWYRQASASGPTTGIKGSEIFVTEQLKTIRDAFLYSVNSWTDSKPEYDICVSKENNFAQVYLGDSLVREFPVATGKIVQKDKTKFGEFVTPSADYIVIDIKDREELEDKFGDNADLYGNVMFQLSGPWAPYIALHETKKLERIGNYASNGCVDLREEDGEWLKENLGIGSRVHIK